LVDNTNNKNRKILELPLLRSISPIRSIDSNGDLQRDQSLSNIEAA